VPLPHERYEGTLPHQLTHECHEGALVTGTNTALSTEPPHQLQHGTGPPIPLDHNPRRSCQLPASRGQSHMHAHLAYVAEVDTVAAPRQMRMMGMHAQHAALLTAGCATADGHICNTPLPGQQGHAYAYPFSAHSTLDSRVGDGLLSTDVCTRAALGSQHAWFQAVATRTPRHRARCTRVQRQQTL
jgi:hypothetical protein